MTLVKIVNGDLLDAEERLIIHQVNCQGKMNSGVAKAIREKWGQVFRDYKSLTEHVVPSELLGTTQVVGIGNKQAVVNMFSQDDYGYDGERYTSYEAFYRCLVRVERIARRYNLSVALPYNIGCDRGGANWNIIYTMIEEVFKNHTQPIVIYNLNGQFQHSFLANVPPAQTTDKELVLN